MASLLISIATTWFAINVLLTPMSYGMQQDLIRLGYFFPLMAISSDSQLIGRQARIG